MLENFSLKLFGFCRKSSFFVYLPHRTNLTFAQKMEEVMDKELEKRKEASSKRKEKREKKERYNGKIRKREWEPETEAEKKIRLDKMAESGEVFERIKRKKTAVILGYSGVNYCGMQRNKDVSTIEEEVLKSMLKHNWIPEDWFQSPQHASFQRCARTDKGVSAARQLISLKLPEEINIEELNKDLPDDIKVFGTIKTTKGFNSKSTCDARSYSYTLPTYTFVKDGETFEENSFRLAPERVEELNKILGMYEGTKNYHNFTIKKQAWDPSAKRFMMSFKSDPPFVPDNTEVEFVRLKVTGQSFMLHQIRRMVGLVIAIMRGKTNFEFFQQVFTKEKYLIPQAPGLGLVLDNVHFDRYNKRYGHDGQHQMLTFEKFDDEVEKFFTSKILPTIIETELKEKSMQTWMRRFLQRHDYNQGAVAVDNESDNEDADSDDE